MEMFVYVVVMNGEISNELSPTDRDNKEENVHLMNDGH